MKKLRFDFAIDESGKFNRDQLHQWLIDNPLVEDHVREMLRRRSRPAGWDEFGKAHRE